MQAVSFAKTQFLELDTKKMPVDLRIIRFENKHGVVAVRGIEKHGQIQFNSDRIIPMNLSAVLGEIKDHAVSKKDITFGDTQHIS